MAENSIIKWRDYLYIGVALSVMMLLRDDNREEFFLCVLIIVFFVLSGLKKNALKLKGFVFEFPIFTVLTILMTINFQIFDTSWPTSGRYAFSVFSIVFSGYVLIRLAEDELKIVFDKLWVLLFLFAGICFVNFLLNHFTPARIYLFYTNPNMEGYAITIFLCISLMFIRDNTKILVGSVFAMMALVCTGSKACTIAGAALVFGFIYIKVRGRSLLTVKKQHRLFFYAMLVILVALMIIGAIFVGKDFIKSLSERYVQMCTDLLRILNGTVQPADAYSSTNVRVMDALGAIEIFPTSDIRSLLLGRGLMHQHFLDLRPIISRIYGGIGGGVAGPAENTFLSLMYDSGMLAFAMYVGVYMGAIICMIKCDDSILRKLSVILVILMIMGLTADLEYIIGIMYSEWLFIGMFIGRLCVVGKKKVLVPGMIGALITIPVIYLLPKIIAYIKTTLNGIQLIEGNGYHVRALLSVSAVILGILLAIFFISVTAYKCVVYKRIILNYALSSVGSAVLIVLGFVGCNSCITQVGASIGNRIDAEREFVDGIREVSDTDIYVDTYPEVYNREIGDIKYSVLCTRGLVAYDNTTVIVDKGMDSNLFGARGFLYAPISDWDAIFTNDDAVINYMQSKGVLMKAYNDYEYVVGGVEADYSGDYSIREYVYSGDYTVTYYMSCNVSDKGEGPCELRIVNKSNDSVLAQAFIGANLFDDGKLTLDIPISINGGDFEFSLIGGTELEITTDKIIYKRTPSLDKHVKIDKMGRVIHEEYYDLDGNRLKIPDGQYGVDYEYDNGGFRKSITYLGEDMAPVMTSYNYAIVRYANNYKGDVIKEEYRDENDEPVVLPGGQAVAEYEYDSKDRRYIERYYGLDGEPVLVNDNYHMIRRSYNNKDQVVREEYFGTDEEPFLTQNGCAAVNYNYDEAGNITECGYLDEEGNPVLITSGYAYLRRTYDEAKRVVREEYYDEEDKPIALAGGQAAVEYEYDEAGNRIIDRYYGVDNEPVLFNNNFYSVKRTYNEKKQNVHEEYFGTDGKPFIIKSGYAQVSYAYDAVGNTIEYDYQDESGKPILIANGYAYLRRVFDDSKRIVREEYYDEEDRPVALAGGQAAVEYEYDEAGNRGVDRHYGVDNEPVLFNDNYFSVQRTYNEKKQNIHEEYFGIDGNPCAVQNGYAQVSYVYDENGNIVEYDYQDEKGKPILTIPGYAYLRREYDDSKRVIRDEYFDEADEPVACADGQAAAEYEYDDEGHRTLARYIGLQGNEIFYEKRFYNDMKQLESILYVSVDDKPFMLSDGYTKIEYVYDTDDTLIKQVYYDNDGNVVQEEQ